MKTKTATLIGPALDWAVAKCEGDLVIYDPDDMPEKFRRMYIAGCHNYSSDWSQGGPIIEEEKMAIYFDKGYGAGPEFWIAGKNIRAEDGPYYSEETGSGPATLELDFSSAGSTPLIAAMRCYVASRLGEEVDIPEELL